MELGRGRGRGILRARGGRIAAGELDQARVEVAILRVIAHRRGHAADRLACGGPVAAGHRLAHAQAVQALVVDGLGHGGEALRAAGFVGGGRLQRDFIQHAAALRVIERQHRREPGQGGLTLGWRLFRRRHQRGGGDRAAARVAWPLRVGIVQVPGHRRGIGVGEAAFALWQTGGDGAHQRGLPFADGEVDALPAQRVIQPALGLPGREGRVAFGGHRFAREPGAAHILHPLRIALAGLLARVQRHAAQRGALDARLPGGEEARPVLPARERGQPVFAEAAADRIIGMHAQEGLGITGRERVDVAAQARVVHPGSGGMAADGGDGGLVQLAAAGSLDRGLERGVAARARIIGDGAPGLGLRGSGRGRGLAVPGAARAQHRAHQQGGRVPSHAPTIAADG